MAKMIMWRDEGKMDYIHKIIKTCNFMNRLILDSGRDFMLGKKKIELGTKDAEC